jgi:hypothetical protein
MAIVAIFREPLLHGFQLLPQAAHLLTVLPEQGILLRRQRLLLLDEFVSLRQLFPQHRILFSQIDQFFCPYFTGFDIVWQVPSTSGQLHKRQDWICCPF